MPEAHAYEFVRVVQCDPRIGCSLMAWRSHTVMVTAGGGAQNTNATATEVGAAANGTTGGAWTSSVGVLPASEALWAFSVTATVINVFGVVVNATLFSSLMLLRRGGQLLGPSVQMLAQQAAVDLLVCAVPIQHLHGEMAILVFYCT